MQHLHEAQSIKSTSLVGGQVIKLPSSFALIANPMSGMNVVFCVGTLRFSWEGLKRDLVVKGKAFWTFRFRVGVNWSLTQVAPQAIPLKNMQITDWFRCSFGYTGTSSMNAVLDEFPRCFAANLKKSLVVLASTGIALGRKIVGFIPISRKVPCGLLCSTSIAPLVSKRNNFAMTLTTYTWAFAIVVSRVAAKFTNRFMPIRTKLFTVKLVNGLLKKTLCTNLLRRWGYMVRAVSSPRIYTRLTNPYVSISITGAFAILLQWLFDTTSGAYFGGEKRNLSMIQFTHSYASPNQAYGLEVISADNACGLVSCASIIPQNSVEVEVC